MTGPTEPNAARRDAATGGAVRTPVLLIAREISAVAAPVPAHNGLVWDGRFRLARDRSRTA